MRVSIVLFPGSNREQDVSTAVRLVTGAEPRIVWHADTMLDPSDLIILPGGFSYGDYLRTGAIAARAPVMRAVVDKARAGVRVLGICNGFQILTEVGLLPGALTRNQSLRFVCREVGLRVANTESDFTRAYRENTLIRCPVAHGEGNYRADRETLTRLEGENRIAFRYAENDNPNGSQNNIAGILNEKGTVLGLMPHPENFVEPLQGGTDGRGLFASLMQAIAA